MQHFTDVKFFLLIFMLLMLNVGNTWAEESTPPPEAPSPSSKDDDEKKSTTINRSSIKINEPVNIYQQTQSDIKHYLPNKYVQPLLAGPDDYLTLIEENHTAINKGVAILIPDFPMGATTPKSINYLRKVLPQEGWTTMTIQPSYSPENYPSTNTDEKERLKDNADALMAYQAKLSQLIPAIMQKAKAYPGLFLVIAEGTHAAMLVNIYQKDPKSIPSALVMLSAYLPTEIESNFFGKNMASLEIPVLDLHLKNDHPFVIKSSKRRKIFAQKELKVYYRQQQIFNFNSSYYPLEQLLKSINGWLKSIGW